MAAQNFVFIERDGKVVDAYKVDEYELRDYRFPNRWLQREVKGWQRPVKRFDEYPYTRPLEGVTARQATKAEVTAWLAEREPEYKDLDGRAVKKGSRVAVAFALGRGAEIRIGVVKGFDLQLGGSTYSAAEADKIDEREQIVIEWEKDNRQWGSAPDKSKIFAYLRRYIVIG
jgi:hypothetical protein